ncbi:MAG: tetratricopeptide repeat protein [Saprospiraceae bacterium]|nr:tetratricopeptide repeat protein [Saprospiraceae bacterium]
MRTLRFIAFLLWWWPLCGTAQGPALDERAARAENLPNDTAKVRQLFELAQEYNLNDMQTGHRYFQKAYAVAKALKAADWYPDIELAIGRGKANLNYPDSALYYFNLATEGYQKQNRPADVANVYTKYRWVYNYLGELEKANEYTFKALEVYEQLDDEERIAQAYYYIADNLYHQTKWQEALQYALKAYAIQKKRKLQEDCGATLQMLGDISLQLQNYEQALAYHEEGLAIRRQLPSQIDIGMSLNSKGNLFKFMKRYPEALLDYLEALKIARASGFSDFELACMHNIGHVYNLLGDYDKALPYLLIQYNLYGKTQKRERVVESMMLLAEAYAGIGRHDSAYYFQKLHTGLRDSILNESNILQMSELQTKYETAQREAKIAVQNAQLKRADTRFWAVVIGLGAALLLGGALYRLTLQLRKHNREKEFLVKEIHHRVKNNLQVLSSLLYLQSRHIKDDAALDAVREGQSRVEAMGLIHQKLYMGDNLAAVEMRDYLYQLGDSLLNSFGVENGRVKIIYHVEPMHLDVDTAIPLGLIINELVTNSLKYAFPDNRAGIIEISLRRNDAGKLHLNVTDNGTGAAATAFMEGGTSFGSSLVEILSKKLGGAPQILTTAEGYATNIEFSNFKLA